YHKDIKRRTHGDHNNFSEAATQASMKKSTLTVVRRYITNFHTNFLGPIPGVCVEYFFFISLLIVIFERFKQKIEDFAFFFTFLLPPMSWYILAKAHSHGHPHMNYVLWYFGFSAVVLLIMFQALDTLYKKTILYQRLNSNP